MKSRRIQIFEHQYLRLGPDGLSESELLALQRFAGGAKYYRLIHRGVQFTQFVGVLQVGPLTIEILPKAGNESNKEIWQGVLLDMLRESRLLKIQIEADAGQNLHRRSLLDVFLVAFLGEVETLLREGLTKKYRTVEANQPALRGHLLFARHLRHNTLHPERFFVRYPHYDTRHRLHQLLHQALGCVLLLSHSAELQMLTRRLLAHFPEQIPTAVSEETFRRVQFDRKTERYRRAISLARLLLLNYRPDLRAGAHPVLALLFDMNRVWEQFLYQRLRKSVLASTYEIRSQASTEFWLNRHLRPDLFLKRRDTEIHPLPNLILDAKWKRLPSPQPSEADLRQMFAYQHHFEAARSVLIFPQSDAPMVGIRGSFQRRQDGYTFDCQTCFLPILAGGRLNPDVLKGLLDQLEPA